MMHMAMGTTISMAIVNQKMSGEPLMRANDVYMSFPPVDQSFTFSNRYFCRMFGYFSRSTSDTNMS